MILGTDMTNGGNGSIEEDWDAPNNTTPPRIPATTISSPTPSKTATAPGLLAEKSLPDDSTIRLSASTSTQPQLKAKKPSVGDDENWDDDFGDADISGGKRPESPTKGPSTPNNDLKPNVRRSQDSLNCWD